MASISVEDESAERNERREDILRVGPGTKDQVVVPQSESDQFAQTPESVVLKSGDQITRQVQLSEFPQLTEDVVGDFRQFVARQEKRGGVQRNSSWYLVPAALRAVDQ